MATPSLHAIPGYTPVRGVAVDRAGALVEGRDEASGQRVLMRILSPALTSDSHLMRRIRSTAQLRTAIRHPNLVSVLAVAPRGSALIYEWVDGITLDDATRGAALDTAAAFVLFDDCLRGLEALQQRRQLHRDLRPESLVIDTTGTGRLRDWDVPSPPLHAGWRAGTPQFMAPELWRGAEPSVASDIYAATCLFSMSLLGRPPFEAEDLAVLRRQHERGDIPGASLPAPIRGLLAEGMAKDPAQRPADTARFRADLEVAAAAHLDDDWRRRGRAVLAGLVRSRLADPRPAAAPPVEEVMATTAGAESGWWRNGRLVAAAFVIAAVLVVLLVVAASALTAPPPAANTPAPVPVLTPTPAASATGSAAAPFTAVASPSLSLAPATTPAPTVAVTPNQSAAPASVAPVTSATPAATPTPTATATPPCGFPVCS